MAVLLLLAGCSDSSGPTKTAVVPTPVDPATAGTIRAEVSFVGTVPAPKPIDMHSVPQCAAAHADPVYDESLQVQDGHVANAVVWIKDGLQKWVFAAPTEPVVIDQKGCLYTPHVVAAMTSQPVEFRNSDAEAHNVHGHPAVVSGWNFLLSRPGAVRTLTFDKPEVAIPVGCDIHPWMRGYVAVVGNPYFAVTPASGSITLAHVPPGEYVVAVWHEKLGTKEQAITLPPSGAVSVQFRYAP